MTTQHSTQPPQPPPTVPVGPLPPDPLAQAGELLRRFAAGETITGHRPDDAATVVASVAYAGAVELRRAVDLLERLAVAQGGVRR